MPTGNGERVPLASGAEFIFRSSPAGYFNSSHPSSRRHYVVVVSGEMEIGASDGTVRRLKVGDWMLAEDVAGKEHTTRVTHGRPSEVNFWMRSLRQSTMYTITVRS